MKSLADFNPTARLYVEMLQASRDSFATGRISFLGHPVDRQARRIRFWTEWSAQALLLAIPPMAILLFFSLVIFLGW